MIKVEGLRKTFGAKVAVNNITFEVPRGQVLGFLGPNGAGKTTTMRILTSFLMPDSGVATIAGHDVVHDAQASRSKLGYLAENAPLYGEMRVLEYLRFVAEVHGISRPKRRIDEVVHSCGLRSVLMNRVDELSRGYRQRTGLAQAIIHDPDVLILDEPTSGLDPNQIVEIRALIKQFGQEKTVILSTHIMQEVTAVCSRVIIISDGKLAADGSPDELQRQARGADLVAARIRGEVKQVQFELSRLPGVQSVRLKDGVKADENANAQAEYLIDVKRDADIGESVFCLVRDKGWTLSELHHERVSLENVFAELTTKSPTEKN